ncbi:alkylated DNA repair protein (DNA oxidative demethylase) [Xanthobacter sp. SG618]|uniref:alpha-ketoglutarate-dependent dioxygenase AlkB family protein n=1 Tax=Xanthobacter sp. SG618 TaxID=2587121 RepID=UPI00145C7C9D|nr:alpha-ketoglutarate-dependent dioxygenase AlkB [Xanthobacter sp. SG618]NMN57872.1 alkylated DNA repair protein (DNA oxidative demethylase) [Xanthobacter sp. SG618]
MTGSAAVAPAPLELQPGALWFREALDREAQAALLADIRVVLAEAPLFTPTMPRSGQPFSVRMSNCGPLGWVSDAAGYRYQSFHPDTRRPWPAMPPQLMDLWEHLAGGAPPPEACLINYYAPDARMSLHQDRDEADFTAPVLSVSLGDTAIFRVGGETRRGLTRSIHLSSGDVFLLSGPSRLAFHGIDRLLPGTSRLVEEGGRFNLTLRRVTAA